MSQDPNGIVGAQRPGRGRAGAVVGWFVAGALPVFTAGCGGDAVDEPRISTGPTPAHTSAAPTPAATAIISSVPTPEPRVPRVEVVDGEVVSARCRLEVGLGQHVEFEVVSDEVDELHIHGYDVMVPLEPDRPARLEVDATIPGVFEVELHHAGLEVCELRVK